MPAFQSSREISGAVTPTTNDDGGMLRVTANASVTLTNSGWTVGRSAMGFAVTGAATLTFAAGASVTLRNVAGDVVNNIQFSSCVATYTGTNEWTLYGTESPQLPDGSITTAKLADLSATTGKISDGAISTAKIADGAVTFAKYADGSIGTVKIASGAATADKLASNSVITAKIADANVTTAKLADAGVTEAKIASSAVTTAKIADANVTTAKIADGAVTFAKYADGSIGTVKIAEGSVTAARLADSAVIAAKIAAGAVTEAKIAAGAVMSRRRQSTGRRLVYVGDSIGLAGESIAANPDPTVRRHSPFTLATMQTRQRAIGIRNASVGGDQTTNVISRWASTVSTHDPSVIVLCIGTNDSAAGVERTPADYAANIETILALADAEPASVILCTVPPTDVSAGRAELVAAYNHRLRRIAQERGLPLVDYHRLLVDEADGGYASGLTSDGTHPSEAGYFLMGDELARVLRETIPDTGDIVGLPVSAADPHNLIPNALMLTQAGSGSELRPDGWSIVSSAHRAGVTASFVSDADVAGDWFQQSISDATVSNTLFQVISSPAIVGGNTYRFCGRVETETMTNTSFTARILFNSSSTAGYEWRAMNTVTKPIESGVFVIDALAPADATSVQVNFVATPTSGSSAVIRIGQLGLYNLGAIGD